MGRLITYLELKVLGRYVLVSTHPSVRLSFPEEKRREENHVLLVRSSLVQYQMRRFVRCGDVLLTR